MTYKDRDLVEELLAKAHPSNVDVTDRAAARIQTLSAENERLRKALEQHGGRYWEARYRDEAAENERLRTGLSLIARHTSNETVSFEEYYECCRTIARAALAGDSHDQ